MKEPPGPATLTLTPGGSGKAQVPHRLAASSGVTCAMSRIPQQTDIKRTAIRGRGHAVLRLSDERPFRVTSGAQPQDDAKPLPHRGSARRRNSEAAHRPAHAAQAEGVSSLEPLIRALLAVLVSSVALAAAVFLGVAHLNRHGNYHCDHIPSYPGTCYPGTSYWVVGRYVWQIPVAVVVGVVGFGAAFALLRR